MVDFKVDLGQIFILTLIAITGWFARREITELHTRMDKTDEKIDTNKDDLNEQLTRAQEKIFDLAGNVQKIMGMLANGRMPK